MKREKKEYKEEKNEDIKENKEKLENNKEKNKKANNIKKMHLHIISITFQANLYLYFYTKKII